MYYIKELRTATKLSQREFSLKFKIPVSTLRKWEQNISQPPEYVLYMLKTLICEGNQEYSIYKGRNDKIYYLDKDNKRVGDSLGNWIKYKENIEGVIEDNIGIYIENLFNQYYEIVNVFNNELMFDKKEKIRWR